ncbi:MAG: hypothetical protein AAFY08_15655 [Planctomycetota bacterium]
MTDPAYATFAPHCPKCRSTETRVRRTVRGFAEAGGVRYRVQFQYRRCLDCGHYWTHTHYKNRVSPATVVSTA